MKMCHVKHVSLFVQLLVLIIPSRAQNEVIYYDAGNQVIQSEIEAKYMKCLYSRNSKRLKVKSYAKEQGEWKEEEVEKMKKLNDGLWEIRSSNTPLFSDLITRRFTAGSNENVLFEDKIRGKTICAGSTSSKFPLCYEDSIRSYYPNGRVKSIAFYRNNKLIWNKNWLRDGANYMDNIHLYVDDTPEHSYGQNYFRQHMLNGIIQAGFDLTQVNDQVIVCMVISTEGKLEGLHVRKGTFSGLNTAILRLLSEMPGHWIPAKLDGKPVNYYMEIPFNFSNQVEGFESVELSGGMLMWD